LPRELPAHEYAEIFPFRTGPSLVDLADSIASIGQKEPCVRYKGKVLEGRRRQAACIMRGIEPIFREFGSRETDGADPLEFSFAVNYHRRDDLTEAEKVMAATKYAKLKFGDNQYSGRGKQGSANAPPSQKEAAKKFNISVDKLKRAKRVMESGVPELQTAYQAGEISVSDAAKIADEAPDVQRAAVKAVKTGKAKTLKAAVAAISGPAPEK